MGGLVKIQMVHVPGSRLTNQGTDGLSRGDISEGVMASGSMLSFVPLHKSALQHRPKVLGWLKSWISSWEIIKLTIEEWFKLGHGLI